MLAIFIMFLASIVAGTFGSMLGLGGGLIVIPVLTLIFKVPMKEAIAASIVTVVATSTSAAVVYVEKHYVNVRLGMVLEMATTIGALIGGFTVAYLSPSALRILFTALLIYTAYNMIRKSGGEKGALDEVYIQLPVDASQDEIDEHVSNGYTPYTVRNLPAGMGASLVAGAISGLLGVGGGLIKVPVMKLAMGVPMRVAIATSNFMIGVTAATSALIYYSRGMINPSVTVPCVLGVLLGAQIGTRLARKVNVKVLTWLFIGMIAVTAVQMIWKALSGAG